MRNQFWHGGIVLAGVIAVIAGPPGCCSRQVPAGPLNGASKYVSQVMEGEPIAVGKAWNGSRDVYLDMRRAKDPIGTGTGAPHATEHGVRVVFGPNPVNTGGGAPAQATLASEVSTTPSGQESTALLDVDGGYAAVWGYRPRVRMRRLIAGSDGTTLIVQYRAVDDIHRIYVLDKPDASKKVSVYNETDNALLFEWTENDTYVDVTPGPVGSTPQWGTPQSISTDPEAKRFVDAIREKMK